MHKFYLYAQLFGMVFSAFNAGWAFGLHRHGLMVLSMAGAALSAAGAILYVEFAGPHA